MKKTQLSILFENEAPKVISRRFSAVIKQIFTQLITPSQNNTIGTYPLDKFLLLAQLNWVSDNKIELTVSVFERSVFPEKSLIKITLDAIVFNNDLTNISIVEWVHDISSREKESLILTIEQ